MVLQDFPLSTNVQISDEVLGRIIDDYPSLVMLKHEDWPGLAKISRGPRGRGRGASAHLDPLWQRRLVPCRRSWRGARTAR